MEVSKEFLAERYASMSKTELMALPVDKLTPEAREVYQQEIARRRISEPEQATLKATVQAQKKAVQDGENALKKKELGRWVKGFCALGALFIGGGLARGYVIEPLCAVVVVMAIAFIFRKSLSA